MLGYHVESAADLALSMARLTATGLMQPQSTWSLTAGQAMLRSLMGGAVISSRRRATSGSATHSGLPIRAIAP